ncbi:MAG: DUF488 domain-containing protein [Gluconacetobacter diazotrophicus]|nr:DUF488 domain-containing protein [Gluconacetobacter diazotrophicus]
MSRPTPPPDPPPLFTIGYEEARFDEVRTALRAAGVQLVIDVRAIASSRRAGFSKRLLAEELAEAGIGYEHLRDLGTPKPGRDAARRGDISGMERVFRAHMAEPAALFALGTASERARTGRACLLCFERDHRFCHRRLVADMIRAGKGQAVVDLLPEKGFET